MAELQNAEDDEDYSLTNWHKFDEANEIWNDFETVFQEFHDRLVMFGKGLERKYPKELLQTTLNDLQIVRFDIYGLQRVCDQHAG